MGWNRESGHLASDETEQEYEINLTEYILCTSLRTGYDMLPPEYDETRTIARASISVRRANLDTRSTVPSQCLCLLRSGPRLCCDASQQIHPR